MSWGSNSVTPALDVCRLCEQRCLRRPQIIPNTTLVHQLSGLAEVAYLAHKPTVTERGDASPGDGATPLACVEHCIRHELTVLLFTSARDGGAQRSTVRADYAEHANWPAQQQDLRPFQGSNMGGDQALTGVRLLCLPPAAVLTRVIQIELRADGRCLRGVGTIPHAS